MIERRITLSTDAALLAPRMRAEDKAEVLAMGQEPLEALQESVDGSAEAFTWWLGDDIVAMAGVVPESTIGPTARAWMLGGDLIPRHRRYFLRESRRVVDRWQEGWPVLWNLVDNEYRAALRWVEWLGFTLRDPRPVGTGLFWLAERERSC